MNMRFTDRTAAGRLLAGELLKLKLKRPVVYALPRGGLPVAFEVAQALHAPLDLLLVRKIGVPWQRELAAGAVADDAQNLVFNKDVISEAGMQRRQVEEAAKAEIREIERRRAIYLRGRAPVEVKGREAIIVDDGIATGSTVQAAIMAVKRREPSRVIVATPVAPADTVGELRTLADEVVCLSAPEAFYAISAHYDDFRQLTDEDVVRVLNQAPAGEGEGGAHADTG
jgi:putative phosphoribosyl transferase